MSVLTQLSPITTAATALSNLVLVSPQATIGYQPTAQGGQAAGAVLSQLTGGLLGAKQPPALLFHYEGEQTARLESDITDHYVEDNTAIQDQWALKPEKVTTHGFIGELNDIAPPALQILKTLAEKLTVIDAYTPELSATAILAYNEAFLLYQVGANAVNSAVSAWSSINGTNGENVIGSQGLQAGAFNPATASISNNQNKQQVAFQQFYGYWKSRTLFTIQTPWAIFQNMAIESLEAVQDETTRVISDFKVSFKMIRTTTAAENTGLSKLQSGRASQQNAGLTDLGTSTPQSSISVGTGLSNMGVA
jgi:hypothetical protein